MALTKIKRMNKKWRHENRRRKSRDKLAKQKQHAKKKPLKLVKPFISDDPVDNFIHKG